MRGERGDRRNVTTEPAGSSRPSLHFERDARRAQTLSPVTSVERDRREHLPSGAEAEAAPRTPNVAIVLWSGQIGGAEVFMTDLARHLPALGVAAKIVFVGDPEPLRTRAREEGLPYLALGFGRG